MSWLAGGSESFNDRLQLLYTHQLFPSHISAAIGMTGTAINGFFETRGPNEQASRKMGAQTTDAKTKQPRHINEKTFLVPRPISNSANSGGEKRGFPIFPSSRLSHAAFSLI